MTGADIIYDLLVAHEPLLARVPEERIACGRLGQVQLPAILIETVSSVERQRLKRGASVVTVDRTSVTVRAANYDDQCVIVDLVTDACADRVGPIAGSPRATVLTAGRGPDMWGPGDSYEQAQDFRITFDKPVSQGE